MVVPIEMGWRDLLFAHYRVDRAQLRPLVPRDLELDTFDGDAWVSIIPLVNVALRPRGLPRALGIRLPELNVRTYVSYRGRPAIYFFSLDADGLASVLGARLTHHLPYYFAAISHTRTDGRIAFESRRRHHGARSARYAGEYWPVGSPHTATDRARSEFLLERYRFFTEDTTGTMRVTEVSHPSWPVYDAEVDIVHNTMLEATGLPPDVSDPIYQYSPGVDVEAAPSRRVEDVAGRP